VVVVMVAAVATLAVRGGAAAHLGQGIDLPGMSLPTAEQLPSMTAGAAVPAANGKSQDTYLSTVVEALLGARPKHNSPSKVSASPLGDAERERGYLVTSIVVQKLAERLGGTDNQK